jgi:predicted phosphohydrolase
MRIVATSDTHFFVPDEIPIPDGDVFLHCGDLMYTGYVDEWQSRIDWLSRLTHKHKYIVPGNHDYHIAHFAGIARAELRKQAKVNCVLPDSPLVKLPNGMNMLAIPFVTNLNGWAYNVTEEWLEDWLHKLGAEPDVVISHAPRG